MGRCFALWQGRSGKFRGVWETLEGTSGNSRSLLWVKSRLGGRHEPMGTIKWRQKRESLDIFLSTIGSATTEHVQKHHKHCDGALLTLSDQSRRPASSAASEFEKKQGVGS